MKKILSLSILLSASLVGYSQEVISEVQQYVAYQDSLFVLKTTRVTNAGIEGVNDTAIVYSAPSDTAGVSTQIQNEYLNAANTAVARLSAAIQFRNTIAEYATKKTLLAGLGVNLDSGLVQQYREAYTGRWRIFNNDGTSFYVNIAPHPTNVGLFQATRKGSPATTYNVLIYAQHFMRITITASTDVRYLVWDGNNPDRPVFRDPTYFLPTQVTPAKNQRIAKVK